MSYTVFARKYRPQTFDEVVGQQHIVTTLKNAIAQNRLAQAYLFVGPRGTGKTTTARIMAKALNCTDGPKVDFDPNDEICKEIAEGRSMDVLEFDAASNTQVDKIREIIIDNVKYAPTRGKYKVYIVDEVHMLSTSSFNALLKTLEEPPPHVKFVFATTDVQKVPTTIISRCQRFDLRRIPTPEIAAHLLFIAGKENISLSPAAADAIGRGAEGGLRDAESMLDQLVAFCGETIEEKDVLNIFGFTSAQTVFGLVDHLIAGDSAPALGVLHEQSEAGKDLSRLMSDLIAHLRNLLVAQCDPEGVKEELSQESLAALIEQSQRVPAERLLDLIEQFAGAEARMKWAPNKKMHFEIAVIRAIQTLSQATLNEVLETLNSLRGGEAPPPRATSPVAVKPPTPKLTPPPTAKPVPAPAPVAEAAPAPRRSLSASVAAELRPDKPVAPAPTPTPEPPAAKAPEPEPAPVIPPPPVPKPAPVLDTPPWDTPAPVQPVVVPKAEEPAPTPAPAPSPVPVPEPAPAAPVSSESTSASEIWPQVVHRVRKGRPLISSWMDSGQIVEISGDTAVMAFPPSAGLAQESVEKPQNRKYLEGVVSELVGRPITLHFETRAGFVVEAVPVISIKPEPPVDPNVAFRDDPLIKKALADFNAEIISA